MTDRVFRLMERHQKLDDALRRLQARKAADPFEIVRLKKLKLALRDALARIAGPRREPARARRG